jgi:hypothetical protein
VHRTNGTHFIQVLFLDHLISIFYFFTIYWIIQYKPLSLFCSHFNRWIISDSISCILYRIFDSMRFSHFYFRKEKCTFFSDKDILSFLFQNVKIYILSDIKTFLYFLLSVTAIKQYYRFDQSVSNLIYNF